MTAPGLTVGDSLSSTKVVDYNDNTKTNVCERIEIPEQGVLLCEIKKGYIFSDSSNQFLAIDQSASYETSAGTLSTSGMYGCETSSDGQYTALNDGNFPLIISTSKSDDSNLVLTGSGF